MAKRKEDMSMTEKADAAFRQAALKVVQRARETDTPVIMWEDGKVKRVHPDDIELPFDENDVSGDSGKDTGNTDIR
ncbi:MAG: hypothetical protein JXM70_11750 [Pirellulales bacterium]|nr:hypothetical protein [Pirellulales bacterium]